MGVCFMLVDEDEAGRDGEAPKRDVKSVELISTRSGAEEGLTVRYEVAGPLDKLGCTVVGALVFATSTRSG